MPAAGHFLFLYIIYNTDTGHTFSSSAVTIFTISRRNSQIPFGTLFAEHAIYENN